MGYEIYIGEATHSDDPEETTANGYYVVELELPEAPAFPADGMSAHNNGRHPTYTAWEQFTRQTGLYPLLLGVNGLMRGHPGIADLTETHYQQIHRALAQWRQEHPHYGPGFGMESDPANWTLARLEWLDWWIRWALDHCEHPAIFNR